MTTGGSKSALLHSFELPSPVVEYDTFYEYRADRYAPNLFIGRRKCTSTKRLHLERYSQKDAPDHRIFTNLYHNLCEYGKLQSYEHSEGGLQVTQNPSFEYNMFNTVRKNPTTDVRDFVVSVGRFRSSVHHASQREELHLYYLQRVHTSSTPSSNSPYNHPYHLQCHPTRVHFALWYFDQCR